jgi:perosamine synthetase
MKRPIAISLSPNVQKDDIILALKLVLSPIRWFDIGETKKLEKAVAYRLGKGYKSIALNSGRSALYVLLKSLGLKYADEVAVQALTCVAVPNAVVWLNAKPVYVDVDETFNMDPVDLGRKISRKTRAVIIQHSFGTPANVDAIKKVIKGRKIVLIEDCAVSIGATYKGKEVGSLGDASFFSFGRDKVISGVFGSVLTTKSERIYKACLTERDKLSFPSPLWTIQQLIHPLAFSIILPLYNVGYKKFTVGKILLFTLQKLGILSRAIYSEEVANRKPGVFPTKLPGSLAALALNQLNKLEKFNEHRKNITMLYFNRLKQLKTIKLPKNVPGSVWLRPTIITENANNLLQFAKTRGVLLGDWYRQIVFETVSLAAVGYRKGDCVNAEKLVGKMVNLPTYPTLSKKQAEKVVEIIKQWTDIK